MARLFGTDGVRGVANTELTPELAMALGKAGACVLTEPGKRPLILIAKDTRISGDMLEDAISAGILSMGGDVIKAGVLPTPGVAYMVRKLHADAGVVISASHNPYEYNGIKFFNSEGFKLDDALEDEIEAMVSGKKELAAAPIKVPSTQPINGAQIRPYRYLFPTSPFCPLATANTSSVLPKAIARRCRVLTPLSSF